VLHVVYKTVISEQPYYSHFFYWSGPNRHDLYREGSEVHAPGRFFADLMVEEASRFLRANQHRPFFLYFAINEPHYPYLRTDIASLICFRQRIAQLGVP